MGLTHQNELSKQLSYSLVVEVPWGTKEDRKGGKKMSLMVETTEGEVQTQFVGIPIEGVAIGEHEIPLEHFCYMAMHFLSGGFFGWGDGTPDCVNKSLTALFNTYAKAEDGKWVRKSFKEMAGDK